MNRVGRLICVGAAATMLAGTAASAASASTLYVSGKTGKDTNACTEPGTPCKTIGAAVTKSEVLPGTATIEVGAGIYEENVKLETPADNGTTINGAGAGGSGTEIVGVAKSTSATVKINLPSGTAKLSNLSVVNLSGDEEDGIDAAAVVTLNNVAVDMQSATNATGISSGEVGSVTMNGGSVTMESGTEGAAIVAHFVPFTVNAATVAILSGSKASGIEGNGAPLSVSSTSVNLASGSQGIGIGIELGSAALSHDSVEQGGATTNAIGVGLFLPESATLEGVTVSMTNPASSAAAIRQALGTARYEHIEAGGVWQGPAFQGEGGQVTIADSRLTESPAGTSPVLGYFGLGDEPGLVVQRTVMEAAPKAVPGALLAINANATLDSSELLGGVKGVFFQHGASKQRTVTIAASTIDAGEAGVADGPGVHDVEVGAGGTASHADVAIEGSILLEQQAAGMGPGGNSATVTCSNSDVPSQLQAATGTEGSIQCASGSAGNTHTEPAALFSSPITGYQLNPLSSAVDSVPAGAISLPFGLTPSSTDLAGNPRVLDGNGDCLALQDKGAFELQGHAVACPRPPAVASTPPGPKPVAGVISGLTISPSAFYAAPSGATITSAKRKYGATVSYRDSQAATTTFTVLRVSSGRRQGKSCRRPSRSNQHGKRCTLLTALGSFTHTDTAGTAVKLHFSGRLKGKRLAHGAYRLQAVAHNAAGNGAAATKSFTIK